MGKKGRGRRGKEEGRGRGGEGGENGEEGDPKGGRILVRVKGEVTGGGTGEGIYVERGQGEEVQEEVYGGRRIEWEE